MGDKGCICPNGCINVKIGVDKMPGNNYNYGAGYIMGQDKQSVDQNVGETQLYRESLEFDTKTAQGVL